MKRVLSDPMKRLLLNLHAGLSVNHHCKTQSDYGGLEHTVRALVQRGLMTWDNRLTKAGTAVAESLKAKP